MRIILDIETNLAHDKIWCVVTREVETDLVLVWDEPAGLQFYMKHTSEIIAHNGIFFDFPVLKRVWGITVKKSQVVDTLVLSRLYNPSLEDGHSLESWGNRLGFEKMDYKKAWLDELTFEDNGNPNSFRKFVPYKDGDWFNKPNMKILKKYCIQDTVVTKKLYEHLTQEMQNGYSKESIKLEHEVAIIIAEQERNGFKLNQAGALQLLSVLKTKLDTIQVEMASIFADKVTTGRVHKTSGKPLKDIIEPFNPGSRQQIA